MVRRAECCCGQCWITVEGEPEINGICHCDDCRKGTGTAFGWSAYFPDGQVLQRSRETMAYQVSGDHLQIRYFCSRCASTLYWTTESMSGLTGISGGSFVDIPLPEPQLSLRTGNACPWIAFPEDWELR